MREEFRSKCKEFKERWDVLNSMLEQWKQQLMLHDLSTVFETTIKQGRQTIDGFDWIEEIYTDGDTFTLLNKAKDKYRAYVIYTQKGYHAGGLGLMYKKEIISPQLESEVEGLISKHNEKDLGEMIELMDQIIKDINQDIEFLQSDSNAEKYEHYYGEYNKGLDSWERYETISEVLDDYRKY